MKKIFPLIGGILLISGTTIGAGMLALPVSSGLAGFFPSLFLLIVCWLFMTTTAFLLLEVNLWMEPGTNLISMARRTLGKGGEFFSWATYLFLLYALTTAYIAGSGPIITDFIGLITGFQLPQYAASIPILLLFGLAVYKGTAAVDLMNRILMVGLVISYGLLVLFLAPHVKGELLERVQWVPLVMAVSIAITSFGFHIIIPSLTTYLDRDVKKLKYVLWIGSVIPLIVYIVWEFIALGILPLEGEHGIRQGFIHGYNGAYLLSKLLSNEWFSLITRCFALFAIVTSFLGVSLSLSDFLADGFKIKKTRQGRVILYLLTFIPPLIFTLSDPRAFLSALEYGGAFGVVTLLGLLPALMVWRGRYKFQFDSSFRVIGGQPLLIVVILFSIAVISLEILNKLKMI